MKDSIFLLHPDKKLTRMTAEQYESEDLLQALLADYPDLLAGGQIDRQQPRRWLLVRREMGVPAGEGGGSQWSMDHLFLDQDGVPTILEVKRASDTRIRREVVGQVLDYAANGVRYWPIDALRSEFAQRCVRAGADPDATVREQLGVDDVDSFWATVRQNLEVGRLRLVFVADEIPSQLQRIIEFLNDQMQRTEVVGLEVRQYVSAQTGMRTLVPRVIGETAQSQVAKGKARTETYEEQLAGATPETRELERRLRAWAEQNSFKTSETRTALRFDTGDDVRLFLLFPSANYVEFRLGTLLDVGMTVEAEQLTAAMAKFAGRPRTSRTPSVSCHALLDSWTEVHDSFLPRYVATRREAYARKARVAE